MKFSRRKKRFVKRIWYWNIRSKFFLSYAGILLAALVILGSYAYIQANSQIKYNLENALDIILQNTCQDIENDISQCAATMTNIIRNKRIYTTIEQGYSRERDGYTWRDMEDVFIPTIESFLVSNENIERLTVYTSFDVPETGTMLLHERRIKEESWYQESQENYGIRWFFKDGELFAAWEMRDLWSKTLEQNHVGTLYMSVGNNIFPQNTLTDSGEGYLLKIVDKDKNVIYPAEDTAEYEILNDKQMRMDNRIYTYKEQEIEGIPFSLSVYVPNDTAYHGLNKIFFITLMMILCCILLLGLPGVFFSFAITENVRRLSRAMDQIGKGNLDVEIDVKKGDEIEIIAAQMKKMLTKLKETIQTLYKTTLDKQRQELQTLQAQINPHFLYNALSTIKWTAMEENADSAAYMAEQLSEFYRTSLNRGETMITFENELRNAKAYISMELVIYDNDFDVEYDIDEDIYHYTCINFILQPIIENAIFHGIKGKQEGRGKIILTARVAEDIEIAVTDNGAGIPPEVLKHILTESGTGYGLANIRNRIRLTFGEEYGMNITSDAGGTCVALTLPKLIQNGEAHDN